MLMLVVKIPKYLGSEKKKNTKKKPLTILRSVNQAFTHYNPVAVIWISFYKDARLVSQGSRFLNGLVRHA